MGDDASISYGFLSVGEAIEAVVARLDADGAYALDWLRHNQQEGGLRIICLGAWDRVEDMSAHFGTLSKKVISAAKGGVVEGGGLVPVLKALDSYQGYPEEVRAALVRGGRSGRSLLGTAFATLTS